MTMTLPHYDRFAPAGPPPLESANSAQIAEAQRLTAALGAFLQSPVPEQLVPEELELTHGVILGD